jgi:hypothetical protein
LLAQNREIRELLEELGDAQIDNAGDGILEARVKLALATEPEAPLRRALRSAAAGVVAATPRIPR